MRIERKAAARIEVGQLPHAGALFFADLAVDHLGQNGGGIALTRDATSPVRFPLSHSSSCGTSSRSMSEASRSASAPGWGLPRYSISLSVRGAPPALAMRSGRRQVPLRQPGEAALDVFEHGRKRAVEIALEKVAQGHGMDHHLARRTNSAQAFGGVSGDEGRPFH